MPGLGLGLGIGRRSVYGPAVVRLPAPENLLLVEDAPAEQIDASWDAVPGALGYEYRRLSDSSWTDNGLSTSVSNLVVGETDGVFLVRAYDAERGRSASAPWTMAPTVPVNTVAPAISGTVLPGETLSCSSGTWTGSNDFTYSYSWKLNGDDVGTDSSEYTIPVDADNGDEIYCVVTATNAAGSTPANSNTVEIVDATFTYLRPDGVSTYLRPDGVSTYIRP